MELAAIVAAIGLIETLLPIIQQRVKNGTITPEEQQKVLDDYKRLKTKADGVFTGPEWEINP